jgi:hypothetical protein
MIKWYKRIRTNAKPEAVLPEPVIRMLFFHHRPPRPTKRINPVDPSPSLHRFSKFCLFVKRLCDHAGETAEVVDGGGLGEGSHAAEALA